MGLCATSSTDPDEDPDEYSLSVTAERRHIDEPPPPVNSHIDKKYEFHQTLAKNAHRRVVKGIDTDIKENAENKLSIKIRNRNIEHSQEAHEHEVRVLSQLNHKNIVHFIDSTEDNLNYYIMTRLCTGEHLFDRMINSKNNITENIAASWIQDILLAIKHLHEKQLIHRGLDHEQFIFANDDTDANLILVDLADTTSVEDEKMYPPIVSEIVGKYLYYMAPEMVLNYLNINTNLSGKLFKCSNVWAIGVMTYIMMTGTPPFVGDNNKEILTHIIKNELQFPKDEKLSDHFKDFVSQLLNKKADKRATVAEALSHPWIQGKAAVEFSINKKVLMDLKQFCIQFKLTKAVNSLQSTYEAQQSEDDIEKHFSNLDTDRDGFLNSTEISYLLSDMGFLHFKVAEEAKQIFEQVSEEKTDYSDTINFQNFKKMYDTRKLTKINFYSHHFFSVLDYDHDGYIDCDDCKELKQFMHQNAAQKLDIVLSNVEQNDGKLTFEQWQNIFAILQDLIMDEEKHESEKIQQHSDKGINGQTTTELTEVIVQSKTNENTQNRPNRGFSLNTEADEQTEYESCGCWSYIANCINWLLLICTGLHLNWTLCYVGGCIEDPIVANCIFTLNAIATSILVSYYGFIESGVYNKVQSWMIAYISWITIIWFQFLLDAIVGNYYFDKLSRLSVMRMKILGIRLTKKKRLYAHKYNDHWMVAISSLLPTAIIGFIANYFVEEKFLLKCDSKFKTGDICYDDGRGCCLLLSSHEFENTFDFAARLASHILAAFGFIRIIAWFMMSKSRFSKLAKKD
eukprot:300802_1